MTDSKKAAAFDEIAAAFADYGTSVRGDIRYQITQRNLKQYVQDRKLNVLDIGGGSGGDTAWLLSLGHTVTFIEPSTEQLKFAERRFNFLLSDDERTRLQYVGATTKDLPKGAKYDLVLLHTVATFQPNPIPFIASMLEYVAPKGQVSLLEKGYYGTVYRDIRDRKYEDLERVQKVQRTNTRLSQDAFAFKPKDLQDILTKHDFTVIEWSGVRVVADEYEMPVERLPPKQIKTILEIEYEMGHHPAIRGQGQLLHFIAQKNR